LVRQIAKGALSPQSIQRAAAAMPAGKFRFVNNLGRGQFNIADRVVGNVGGHAGEMVRKLPTRQVGDVAEEYAPFRSLIDNYNQQYQPGAFQRAWGFVRGRQPAVPIAPYVAANARGGFQQLATGHASPPRALTKQLDDLHSGNIGPHGQIIDFTPRFDTRKMGLTPTPFTPLGQQFQRKLIDPVGHIGMKPQFDIFGNMKLDAPRNVRQVLTPELPRSNDLVRKYWALPAAQRAQWDQMMQQPAGLARYDRVANGYAKAMSQDVHDYLHPELAATATYHPKRQWGFWTDYNFDPAPYWGTAGLGAAGASALGYGGYKAYQALADK
jgi:hypothetical protein